jgi:hypothetical protein
MNTQCNNVWKYLTVLHRDVQLCSINKRVLKENMKERVIKEKLSDTNQACIAQVYIDNHKCF